MLKKYNSLSRKQPLDSVQDTMLCFQNRFCVKPKIDFYNATNMCAV